ncbi:cytochrome c1 [Spectribacter hydrogenooxidans]|uniref:Cytochrome c1 n=1 Tax=Spectribacter hydrogenoxidans TaxID=3075608 RepID=A0ABU3BXI9_9GAMM|nr:cytochrome c1 [Salinisphaera sp. W335]MDT0633859.1 cytochrome c1 [Salinisphaera sp. W335]
MMRRAVLILSAALVAPGVWAAGGYAVPYDFSPDLGNEASLQRGASLFMNYCSGCHSLQYLRYQRMTDDLGIPEEMVQENLIFSNVPNHERIHTGLPDESSKWFGKAPPDLTLVARSRGADWLYSFLRTYYLDDSRPTGVNNVVFSNTAMPHVLAPLQGYQAESAHDDGDGGHGGAPEFELVQAGSMSEDQYEQAVADITNFLVYAGEPAKMVRYGMGVKVILFLAVFTLLAWLLKREFWRDVH